MTRSLSNLAVETTLMRHRFLSLLMPVLASAGLMLLAPAPSLGQYKAPRTPHGTPDLQGIWQASDTASAYNIEPHTPSLGIPGGLGIIVDPPNRKIPYKPEARAQQQENFANRETLDPLNGCYLPGVPRVMYLPFPLQIIQTPEMIVILSEFAHTTRNIFMQGEHLDGLELWMGDSRGHWEGETLVVDVTQNNPDTWFDKAGNHHSAGMHLVERYTRTGPNTLTYEATIEDEAVYTQPWTIRLLLYRHQEPNFRLLEYECFAYAELEAEN